MNPTDSNPPLLPWVKIKIHKLKGAVFLVVSILSAAFNLFVALNLGVIDSKAHMPILYGTQAVIVLIVCAIIAFGQKPQSFLSQYPRGTLAVKQFWKWWPPLWFSWLILYAGLTIAAVYFPTDTAKSRVIEYPMSIIVFGLHQLNNVATLILLMLFHLLARPSVPENEYPAEGDIFPDEQNHSLPETKTERIEAGESKFWFWVALFFVSAMFELALVLFSGNPESALIVFAIGYGIIGATATALVVGKLDDHLFGVPTFVIVFLFIYAGIQPSFDFLIRQSEDFWLLVAREVIVVIALISKIVLFATIQWLSMTDRLLYYMVQSYSLYKGVDSHRQGFLTKAKRDTL
jgi:hypothetical protein